MFSELTKRKIHEENVKKLKSGIIITKHGRKGSPHPRYMYMSKTGDKIMWRNTTNKEKDKGELPLIDLYEFSDGCNTQVFKRVNKKKKDEIQSKCFSVIGKERSLDLEFPSVEKKQEWETVFKCFVEEGIKLSSGKVGEYDKKIEKTLKCLKKWSFDIEDEEWKISKILNKGDLIDEGDANLLSSCLTSNNKIKVIDFSEAGLKDFTLEILLEGLKGTKVVQHLDLSGNALSDQSVTSLMKFISKSVTLKYLNLSNNKIGDESAKILQDCFLKSNLTEVHLSHNLITDIGALCIAGGLKQTSTMKILSLDSNKIGNKGISELCNVIKEKNITSLLDNNLIEFIEPEPKDEDDPDAHVLEINLFLAVDQLNYCEVITLCLEGADVNVQNETDGKTPLHIAALKGDLPLIQFLVTHPKIDINSVDDNQLTPIYCGAEKGHKEIVSFLLEKEADFTIADENQVSVLHLLSEQGNKVLVKLMIEKYGADINSVTVDDQTCLHYAAKSQQHSVIQYLIERDQMERKALQKSEENKNGEEDIDFGQFINWQDSEGQTALHKVFQNEKVDVAVAKLLVSSGAEISIEDSTGATPLEKANEKDKSALMIEARKFTASKK
eukprot:gene7364-11686_t